MHSGYMELDPPGGNALGVTAPTSTHDSSKHAAYLWVEIPAAGRGEAGGLV